MTKRFLGFAGVALGLVGCSLIPSYERPALPVSAQWAPASATTSTAPVTELAWQDFYTDASLRQLIALALEHNRDLRVALLNIEQARAQLGLRRADQFPTLNAGVTGARAPNSSGHIVSLYNGGLTVTAYELDFFGRVASLKEQALAQVLATQEGAQIVQISLMASVAQTWTSLLADEESLSIAQQTLVTREDSLRLIQLRFEHGAASELDLRAAQSLVEAARIALAQAQRQRALDENALSLLLGQGLPAALRESLISARLAALNFPAVGAGLPSDMLAHRPDIRQAEQQLLAANANIGAARAAFFPRISLTAGVGSASSELAGLFKSGSWGFTLAPQLLQPIFDAGRNDAALAGAKAGRDIAVAQYEKAIQSAFREVSDALASSDTLGRQLQAQQALAQAEAQRARLSELRYQNGAASLIDWLDAQRALMAAQLALVQTRQAYLQNQILLYKALGGGSRL